MTVSAAWKYLNKKLDRCATKYDNGGVYLRSASKSWRIVSTMS
jgi:hypothetical protein